MKKDKNKDNEISTSDSEEVAENSEKFSRLELLRRKLSVNAARVLFRTIDIVFNRPQNSCPYVNRSNAKIIDCVNDIVYDDSLPKTCTMDFYSVPSQEKMPAVMLIHGGGFSAGGKKFRKGQSQYFALNGFGVFCVDYGLAPDYTFPVPINHLVNAANYIYDNAEKYNIDADRIIVSGDSAGGYYASMLAAFNCSSKLGEVLGVAPKFRFFGAILNCGLYDLQTIFETKYILNVDDAVFLSFIGIRESDFDSYEYKDYCAPIDHITGDYPPTYVVSSAADIFCKGQSDVLLEKFKQSGVYYEYYEARKFIANHCFSLNWRGADAVAANEGMMSFAKRLAAGEIDTISYLKQ